MEWSTLIIAVYGAGLSTYIYIANRRKERPQLSLTFSSESYLNQPAIAVKVANSGHRKVFVDGTPKIKTSDGKYVRSMPNYHKVFFKDGLLPGDYYRFWIENKRLARDLDRNGYSGKVKLFTEVQDRLGKIYKSNKTHEFNIDEWAK